jgi:hypothetical protein
MQTAMKFLSTPCGVRHGWEKVIHTYAHTCTRTRTHVRAHTYAHTRTHAHTHTHPRTAKSEPELATSSGVTFRCSAVASSRYVIAVCADRAQDGVSCCTDAKEAEQTLRSVRRAAAESSVHTRPAKLSLLYGALFGSCRSVGATHSMQIRFYCC